MSYNKFEINGGLEMNILNKFENVEIKNDTRIAPDDLEFCKRNQELYLKVLENYKSVYKDLMKVKDKEFSLFSEIETENSYNYNGCTDKKYDNHFVTISKKEFTKTIIGVHRIFITTIYNYFSKKYGVRLETKEPENIIGLEEPKKVEDYYYDYWRISEEEKEKIKKRNQEYEDSLCKYRDDMVAAKVDFNNIIDDIFIQLDGYSFVDRAKNEVVNACKSACFNKYRKVSYATLKKCKIVIETAFHSYFDTIWKEYQASTNNDDFKAIMRALSFFDSDEKEKKIYGGWLSEFIFYYKKEKDGVYGLHSAYGKKVQSFKFYKNGKWEINFISQEDAEKFFNEYCKQ